MDKLIKRFDSEDNGDLRICANRGVAYQTDMSHRVKYDESYFNKCLGYEDKDIALKINAGRIELVNKYLSRAPYDLDTPVLDIGVGSGEFIKKRPNTYGYDINPAARKWLEAEKRWADDLTKFRAFTFWDVLEHVDVPEVYFKKISDHSWLFTSIPVFENLYEIRKSKHYRPGEHLYYWTERGFVSWMAQYGFYLFERQTFEIDAGRESIYSFAFKRMLPRYAQTIEQYEKLHAAYYGASAWLYRDLIAEQVRFLKPTSILDYGCGRSDLAAHFWLDGRRRIVKYDPAILEYRDMPEGEFDMVICCDVMEHIRMEDIDQVLNEIRAKSRRALFTISMRPAKATLPDGRNAHVTILTESEWTRWVQSVFGKAARIKTKWDHILMLRTW